jgi:hypothetical protein
MTEPPRVTLGGGGGIATPFHADFDFTAGEWQASVRVAMSEHLMLEGFVSAWRHSSSTERVNQLVSGPGGPIGRVGRIETVSQRTVRIVGANLLGRGTIGRVSVYGGGGIGIWNMDRRYTQTSSGCEPAAQHLCNTFESPFSSGTLSAQALVGLDVAITSRVAAFGQFQITAPAPDIAAGHGSVTGGIRLTLK